MKKITLLIFLFAFSHCYSQNISFTDSNFKTVLLYANSTSHFMAKNAANEFVNIDTNNDGEIQQSEAATIHYLSIYDSGVAVQAISIQNLEGLQYFTNLREVFIPNCLVQEIDLNTNVYLEKITIGTNQSLTTLNLPINSVIKELYFPNTQISSINTNNLQLLKTIDFSSTPITTIDFSNCPNLENILCRYALLEQLDVSTNQSLYSVSCTNIPTEQLDFSHNPLLGIAEVGGSVLKSINIKNGALNGFNINGNYPSPNLMYVCCDESEVDYIRNTALANYPNCNVNTYCTFNPGGTYYTINGNNRFDSNSNGCDATDSPYPYFKLDIATNNSMAIGSAFTNTSGNYLIPVQQGTTYITPNIENPNYFTVYPASLEVQFPLETSPYNQNFCITPNGVHYDLEVAFTRLDAQIPGADVRYLIIYKNKGNQLQSGTITLNFNDAIMDFISSNPLESSISTNQLTWNYSNLNPFETREIEFIMNLNSPMETPALNSGDKIEFTGNIQPDNSGISDEYPEDNNINVNFNVVNSADPNDITCLEGNTVGPNQIGKYVHYMIRFENIGTANAMNVVVKNQIDSSKFDVESLIPLSSNYDFVTRKNGNIYEFIFENINLPFDDLNNDGHLVYKIKLKNNLVIGDTFTNQANIYFDFNFPILTNTESTVIQQTLNTNNFSIDNKTSIYPNPASDTINIKMDKVANFNIQIYDLVGKQIGNYKNQQSIDVSNLTSGMYLVKIIDLENNIESSHKIIKN